MRFIPGALCHTLVLLCVHGARGACPAGKYVDPHAHATKCFTQSGSATPCGKGAKKQQAPACAPCARGRYRTALASDALCSGRCAAGRWGERGQTDAMCSGPCFEGHWSAGGATGPKCQGLCPAGKHARSGGCFTCPGGKFAQGKGMTSCRSCHAGTFAKGGAARCSPCQPGRVARADLAPTCDACAAGWFSGSRGGLECQVCAAGTYAPYSYAGSAACKSCPGGRWSKGGWKGCTPCVAGKYSHADRLGCARCLPGRWSRAGEKSPACSGGCALGRYSNAATGLAGPTSKCPGKCETGTSTGVVGGTSASSCAACAPGKSAAAGDPCAHHKATMAPFYEGGGAVAGGASSGAHRTTAAPASAWWEREPTPPPTPLFPTPPPVNVAQLARTCPQLTLRGLDPGGGDDAVRRVATHLKGCLGVWKEDRVTGCTAHNARHCSAARRSFQLQPAEGQLHRPPLCGAAGKRAWLFYDVGYRFWAISNSPGEPPFLLVAKDHSPYPDLIVPGSWEARSTESGEFLRMPRLGMHCPTGAPTPAPTPAPSPRETTTTTTTTSTTSTTTAAAVMAARAAAQRANAPQWSVAASAQRAGKQRHSAAYEHVRRAAAIAAAAAGAAALKQRSAPSSRAAQPGAAAAGVSTGEYAVIALEAAAVIALLLTPLICRMRARAAEKQPFEAQLQKMFNPESAQSYQSASTSESQISRGADGVGGAGADSDDEDDELAM
jgi:hypothetical protein